MPYYNIYRKRINRFGENFQDRMQGNREYDFERYLERSVYTQNFLFEGEEHIGSFEPYKQDETKILHYLLTKVDLELYNGAIIQLNDATGARVPWMVYWKENIKESGYNRYIMVKMTHFIHWKDGESWCYMSGPEVHLVPKIRASQKSVFYRENTLTAEVIMPLNESLHKDDYFEIEVEGGNGQKVKQAFVAMGTDIVSTPGVMYVTFDESHIQPIDRDYKPTTPPGGDPHDYFWLGGK